MSLWAPDIGDESVVVAALFHDLGKVGYPGKPHYLPNGASTLSPIELTDDEAQAIVPRRPLIR